MYKIIACCGLLNSQCFDFIPVVLNFGCIEHFIWSPEVQYIYVRKDNSEVTCNHVLAQVTLPINSSKVKQSLLIMTVYTICTLLNLQQSGKKKIFQEIIIYQYMASVATPYYKNRAPRVIKLFLLNHACSSNDDNKYSLLALCCR